MFRCCSISKRANVIADLHEDIPLERVGGALEGRAPIRRPAPQFNELSLRTPTLNVRAPMLPIPEAEFAGVSRTASQSSSVSLSSTVMPDERTQGYANQVAREIFSDREMSRYIAQPSGACVEAASRVCRMLTERQISHQVRALLIWNGAADNIPKNHVVVTAQINAVPYTIDPTGHQYGNCSIFFGDHGQWERAFKRAMSGRAVCYQDYRSVREMCLRTRFLRCTANRFEGGTILVLPDWFRRVRENPAAEAQLYQVLDSGRLRAG